MIIEFFFKESDTDEETNKLLESNMINNFKNEKQQDGNGKFLSENEDVSNGQAKYYDDSNVIKISFFN